MIRMIFSDIRELWRGSWALYEQLERELTAWFLNPEAFGGE